MSSIPDVLGRIDRRLSLAGLPAYAKRFRRRVPRTCTDPGPPWEPFRYATPDGWPVTAFHHRCGRRLAILSHGLHGDLSRMEVIAGMLGKLGFSSIMAPLRGHDGHPCPTTTGGPDEALDIVGAVLAAEREGYPSSSIVLYGSSMGAASSVKAASLLSGGPVAGVIGHACFTSFFEAAKMKLGAWRASVLKLMLPGEARRSLEDFAPASYLPGVTPETSFVFLAGTRDSVCPPDMGSALAASSARGLFVALGGAGHPRWEHPEMQDPFQLEKALGHAMGFVDRETGPVEDVFIDEEGGVRNVPRSRRQSHSSRIGRV